MWAGGERFVRELMRILLETAQEIMKMARLAFGADGPTTNAEAAAGMGVFCLDGITGAGGC